VIGRLRRTVEVPAEVVEAASLRRGEKVLAGAASTDGSWLLGTRDALLVVRAGVAPTRIPWERVERADWDREEERLVVTEVGEFGLVRPRHEFAVTDPGLLLDLIRERVTASVVLQRRVGTSARRGLTVVARRAPSGRGDISWAFQFDRGVDPEDPAVMAAAEEGLRSAQAEIGH